MPKKNEKNDEIIISLDKFAVPGAIVVAVVIIATAIFFANKDKDDSIDIGDTKNVAGEEEVDYSQYIFPGSTDIGNAPYSGNIDTAKVAIVEFSDYLCGYCQRHVEEVYPSLVEKYIDTGDMIYVYREFSIHGEIADAQAMGGKCVFEDAGLEIYLKYHNDAFMLGSIDAIYDVADSVGANRTNVQTCIESEKYRNEIDIDYEAGVQAGVEGTPGFVVGLLDEDGNVTGKLIVGALPFDAFKQVIESLLAE